MGGVAANAITVVDAAPLWPDGFTAMPAASQGVHPGQRRRAALGPRRDRHAHRHQALGGEGAIIDSEADVGGYPSSSRPGAVHSDEWDLRFMVRKSGAP